MVSKKGTGTFTISLVVIIGMLVLILLISFVYKVYKGSEKNAVLTRCKTSVTAYARINSLPFNRATSDSASIDCPAQFITISKSTPRIMKRDVADLMVECWGNYGEGKLALFKPEDQAFCAFCSVIQFEDKSVKLEKFNSFLMSERAPIRTKEGYSPYYFDYLSDYSTDKSNMPEFENYPSDIDGSKKYAIVFAYYKYAFWSKMDAASKGAIIGAVWAPVAYLGSSSAEWQAKTFIVEYTPDNIKNIGCTEIPVSLVDKRFR